MVLKYAIIAQRVGKKDSHSEYYLEYDTINQYFKQVQVNIGEPQHGTKQITEKSVNTDHSKKYRNHMRNKTAIHPSTYPLKVINFIQKVIKRQQKHYSSYYYDLMTKFRDTHAVLSTVVPSEILDLKSCNDVKLDSSTSYQEILIPIQQLLKEYQHLNRILTFSNLKIEHTQGMLLMSKNLAVFEGVPIEIVLLWELKWSNQQHSHDYMLTSSKKEFFIQISTIILDLQARKLDKITCEEYIDKRFYVLYQYNIDSLLNNTDQISLSHTSTLILKNFYEALIFFKYLLNHLQVAVFIVALYLNVNQCFQGEDGNFPSLEGNVHEDDCSDEMFPSYVLDRSDTSVPQQTLACMSNNNVPKEMEKTSAFMSYEEVTQKKKKNPDFVKKVNAFSKNEKIPVFESNNNVPQEMERETASTLSDDVLHEMEKTPASASNDNVHHEMEITDTFTLNDSVPQEMERKTASTLSDDVLHEMEKIPASASNDNVHHKMEITDTFTLNDSVPQEMEKKIASTLSGDILHEMEKTPASASNDNVHHKMEITDTFTLNDSVPQEMERKTASTLSDDVLHEMEKIPASASNDNVHHKMEITDTFTLNDSVPQEMEKKIASTLSGDILHEMEKTPASASNDNVHHEMEITDTFTLNDSVPQEMEKNAASTLSDDVPHEMEKTPASASNDNVHHKMEITDTFTLNDSVPQEMEKKIASTLSGDILHEMEKTPASASNDNVHHKMEITDTFTLNDSVPQEMEKNVASTLSDDVPQEMEKNAAGVNHTCDYLGEENNVTGDLHCISCSIIAEVHPDIQNLLCQSQLLYDALYYSEMECILTECLQLCTIPQETALVSFGIGLACYEQKKYEEAIQHLQESEGKLQECYRLDPDPTHLSEISYCRVYMGEVEIAQSHYSAAVDHFHVAVETHQSHIPVIQISFQLSKLSLSAKTSKLALALRCANQVADSERYYRKALLCNDATPSDIISAKTSLGNLLHSVGDHERAVEEYIAAIEKAEVENDALSQAWTHGNLGNTYLSLGKYEQGLYYLQKSLELTTIHEPTPSAISRALNNLGTAYQALSKLDEAESYYDEALSQAIFGNDQIGQARAYGNIGNLYMLQKNQERAIPHYSEVLRLSKDRSTVYVAYHNRGCAFFDLAEKRKREQFSNCPRREYQYIAWGPNTSDLECKHYQDELEDNIVQLYKQGLSDFKKVIKNHESTFTNINSSAKGLNLFVCLFEANAKTFLRAQDCAFNLNDHHLALLFAEQCRSRTLGELLLQRKMHQLKVPFRAPLTLDQVVSILRLQDPFVPVVMLSYTGTRLLVWVLVFDGKEVSMNMIEQEPNDDLFEGKSLDMYLRYSINELLTGDLELYGEEKKASNKIKDDKQSMSLEEDSNKLSDSEDEAKEKKDDKGSFNASPVTSHSKEDILTRLYKIVIEPVQAIIKGMTPDSQCPLKKIILIPDSSTKMIPFPALSDRNNEIYFGDTYALQFAPSLLVLGVMAQTTPTVIKISSDCRTICIVGDPYTPPFKFKDEKWILGPLPHARREAQSVGHYMKTTPLIDEEPTKEVVLSRLRQAKLIHLATHGSASHAFIVLAGTRYNIQSTMVSTRFIENENRILLYASDVESIQLQPSLVVLSSCDSGRGVFKGDDVQGMARAFLLSGAQAVLTSLWKVPDQSGCYFMQYFYRYMLDGYTSSEALQKASLSIRGCLMFSQYIHWGGYQLTGKDVKIEIEVIPEDKSVWSNLGRTCSPFPRLDKLLLLEKNLLSFDYQYIQVINGAGGADISEPVIDFIAKHHSCFNSIFWINASHPLNITTTVKDVMEVLTEPALVIVDDVTVDCLPHLNPLCQHYDVKMILLTHSPTDNMSAQIDAVLHRGTSPIISVSSLTDLQVTQRLVYTLVSQFNLTPNKSDQRVVSDLTSLCCGSPVILRLMESLMTHCMTKENDSLTMCLNLIEEKMDGALISQVDRNQIQDNVDNLNIQPSLVISSILGCLMDIGRISTASRTLLNCLSSIRGIPLPLEVITGIKCEIESCYTVTTSIIEELKQSNCLCTYPSPVISSHNDPLMINSKLFIVPDIIGDAVWSHLTTDDDRITAIAITTKSLNHLSLQYANNIPISTCYLPAIVDSLKQSCDNLLLNNLVQEPQLEDHLHYAQCYADVIALEEIVEALVRT